MGNSFDNYEYFLLINLVNSRSLLNSKENIVKETPTNTVEKYRKQVNMKDMFLGYSIFRLSLWVVSGYFSSLLKYFDFWAAIKNEFLLALLLYNSQLNCQQSVYDSQLFS